jgi:hypothetical protein
MSRASVFVETPKGVCIMNPIMGEFTICGDAFDLYTDEPEYEQIPTARRVVTCPDCALIVKDLQNVRTSI